MRLLRCAIYLLDCRYWGAFLVRGFFGIGIFNTKSAQNIGTLWRTAHNFGANFIFTVGARYSRQASDTTKAYGSIPLYCYADMKDLVDHLPLACRLIGIELGERSKDLRAFIHPETACYLLGAEDRGLPPKVQEACHQLVVVPGGARCLNVATAGSIVIYDRYAKG